MLKEIFYQSFIKESKLALFFITLLLIPSSLFSQEEDYVANYGRVRYLENKVTIMRGTDGIMEETTLNAPIFPGDTLITSRDGKAELQLADSSIIRMNYATKLRFQALSDLYNQYEQSTILKFYHGSIYIEAENMEDKEKNFQIDTPYASIYILTDGLYRINVDSEQKVEAFCYRGVAEVVGEYDSVLLRSGKMTFVTYHSSPADPRGFNSFFMDSFDRWNDEREEFYYQSKRIDEYDNNIPYEIRPYYTELSYYGDWVYLPVYGYVWYPYYIYAGWRPYYNGYWCLGPYGYFWVSYEPWGWAPYHYGRWSWVSGYGWVWCPGTIFSGAWVYWSYGPSCIGWCPIDYWNRPAFISVNLYLNAYDFRTWNFVHYRDIHQRHLRHAVLRGAIVEKELNKAIISRRSPKLKPHLLSRDKERRRKMLKRIRRDEAERVVIKDMRRRLKNKASFKELEKEIKKKPLNRKPHPLVQRKTSHDEDKHPTRKLKKDNLRKRVTPSPKRHLSQSQEFRKSQESKRRSLHEKKWKERKSHPGVAEDYKKRGQAREFYSRPSHQGTGDRLEKDKIRSYSRKMSERTLKRNRAIRSLPKRSKPSSRYRYQREIHKKYYEKPKSHINERRLDSSRRWKKMLRNMSHPRKTYEIKKKAPMRKETIGRRALKHKPGGPSSSPGKKKSSSGQSRKSGRRSRNR